MFNVVLRVERVLLNILHQLQSWRQRHYVNRKPTVCLTYSPALTVDFSFFWRAKLSNAETSHYIHHTVYYLLRDPAWWSNATPCGEAPDSVATLYHYSQPLPIPPTDTFPLVILLISHLVNSTEYYSYMIFHAQASPLYIHFLMFLHFVCLLNHWMDQWLHILTIQLRLSR